MYVNHIFMRENKYQVSRMLGQRKLTCCREVTFEDEVRRFRFSVRSTTAGWCSRESGDPVGLHPFDT